MTFPSSLHPNSFSFPSFDLNIFFLQCKQSLSIFLSVESAISKRLEGLKFVNFLGAAPLDPLLGCAVSPSCFTRPLRGLADSTSCYPCSHIYPPASLAPLGPEISHVTYVAILDEKPFSHIESESYIQEIIYLLTSCIIPALPWFGGNKVNI